MNPLIYYAEEKCPHISPKGKECNNRAYYYVKEEDVISCGVHARNSAKRKELPKRSAKEKALITKIKHAREDEEIEEARQENSDQDLRGHVVVSKMRMMKQPEDIFGYRKIFPNFKHGSRKDGLGLPELSPMSLGPVNHPQPGLPPAENLENCWQALKVFPDYEKDGNPTEAWYETRLEMYEDPIPHRHHKGATSSTGSKNVPLYAIWVLPDEEELRLPYIKGRQIYCTYYERLGKKTKSYKTLMQMVNEGTNVQIIGYDGYDIGLTQEDQMDQKKLTKAFEKFYLDGSRPFGHELVLAALLLLEKENYPWVKYTTLEL